MPKTVPNESFHVVFIYFSCKIKLRKLFNTIGVIHYSFNLPNYWALTLIIKIKSETYYQISEKKTLL